MSVRLLASLISLFVAFSTWGCLELGTTNGSGGAGNATTSGTGAMGAGGAGGDGGTASSSSGSPNKCADPNATCSVCGTCVKASGGACFDQYTACQDEPSCVEVAACLEKCPEGDGVCRNSCLLNVGMMGMQTFYALYFCVYCDACAANCAMDFPCAG